MYMHKQDELYNHSTITVALGKWEGLIHSKVLESHVLE